MSDTETTKTIEELVMEIPKEEVAQPTIPVEITVTEAADLLGYATEDKEVLIAKGLTEEMLNDLGLRSRFLQDKQGDWLAVYEAALTNTEAWSKKVEEASLLQQELKHDFQFAFRKKPKALKVLQITLDGDGSSNMRQDLINYPKLAAQYPLELEAIKFDNNKLTKAKTLAEELLLLHEKVDGVKNSANRVEKQMRDRAYTYLKQLVDEIRAYGKYAFWNNEEKQRRYASEYQRENYKKYLTKNENQPE